MGPAGPPGPPGPPGYAPVFSSSSGWVQKGPDPYMQYDQPQVDSYDARENLNLAVQALLRVGKPTGKAFTPARTCRELKEKNEDFKDGEYYVDPNGEDARDAFKVHCRMAAGQTCIHPQNNGEVNHADFIKPTKAFSWGRHSFMSLTDSEEFQYNITAGQLKALSALSEKAHQTVTFHCLNTEVEGMELVLNNGKEIDMSRRRHMKTTIRAVDECVKDNQWHTAEFTVRTRMTDLLPIEDANLVNIGRQNQVFSFKLGEVCFQ